MSGTCDPFDPPNPVVTPQTEALPTRVVSTVAVLDDSPLPKLVSALSRPTPLTTKDHDRT